MILERRGTAERPILRLDLASDRDGAEALRGRELSVPLGDRSPTPRRDEFFHVDLIGCSVRCRRRASSARSHDVLAYPANDVLEVRPDDGSEPLLIPFAEDVVTAVDVSERVVTIREDFL